jgi:subtilisin family serine protease
MVALSRPALDPLALVSLTPLMQLTEGIPEIKIGLIDGPVATNHPEFAGANFREIGTGSPAACTQASSVACQHGTFIASILCGQRGSMAPAICPGCTVLVRPIFAEPLRNSQTSGTTPAGLSTAILECLAAGAKLLNLSVALEYPAANDDSQLAAALNLAAQRGAIVIAAAGNQGTVGSSPITRHPWVIPVVACDLQGKAIPESNLAASLGRWGLAAPGQEIQGFSPTGATHFSGTSPATAFVTGAIALLWSVFPKATAGTVKAAISHQPRRATIVPPLLNAWAAYQTLAKILI